MEILADTCIFRLHPLSASDARGLDRRPSGSERLLRGYRGAPPADEAALRDTLRVSAAAADHRPQKSRSSTSIP